MATPTRGSEAYDLSLFEPKQAKIVPLKPNKKQAKAQQRRSRIQSLLNTAVTLALAGLVITSLGMMVAGRVRITEMDAQITTQQEQLSNLQSEHVRIMPPARWECRRWIPARSSTSRFRPVTRWK